MRLIDADYITEDRVSNDPVAIAAKCASTIDAIPVEWIVSWINRHPNDLRCVWFASIEMEWKKEQEAR